MSHAPCGMGKWVADDLEEIKAQLKVIRAILSSVRVCNGVTPCCWGCGVHGHDKGCTCGAVQTKVPR